MAEDRVARGQRHANTVMPNTLQGHRHAGSMDFQAGTRGLLGLHQEVGPRGMAPASRLVPTRLIWPAPSPRYRPNPLDGLL